MTKLKPDRELRFRALYAEAYLDVLRFAQRRVHPSQAEDVVADAFLVASPAGHRCHRLRWWASITLPWHR
ncbi:hypothetical protein ABZ671_02215 [Micromonospora sp. NPDC006766]|uniref:hypothetical protein n=1 Tax=Micromonospora sp. NPDC006766 TaxID=3154778 RepID=UPI0033F865A1